MEKEQYQEMLKQLFDQMREVTLMHLLKHDETYIRETKKETQAEQAYMDLKLETQSKEVVEKYITCINNVYSDYSSLSYLAGVKDALMFLASYDLLK